MFEDAHQHRALWQSFSKERLGRYLDACAGDQVKALDLYKRNLQLSSHFYIPLQCLEITLRNTLSVAMSEGFGRGWLLSGALPVGSDTYDWVQAATAKLGQAAIPQSAIIAELSLGFWVSLLAQRYAEPFWKRCLFRAFTSDGRYMNRKHVHQRLNTLRRFRNRVAHHEPIIFNDLAHTHGELIEAISWMCPITAQWTAEQSSVMRHLP
jgi:hypothetical protein